MIALSDYETFGVVFFATYFTGLVVGRIILGLLWNHTYPDYKVPLLRHPARLLHATPPHAATMGGLQHKSKAATLRSNRR